jgi:hypothetical protein
MREVFSRLRAAATSWLAPRFKGSTQRPNPTASPRLFSAQNLFPQLLPIYLHKRHRLLTLILFAALEPRERVHLRRLCAVTAPDGLTADASLELWFACARGLAF